MIRILPYTEDMKLAMFELTDRVFAQCGKKFEPQGRHGFYNDVVRSFVQFWCMFDDDKMIGTVALKLLSDYDCELKALYLEKKYHGRGLGRQLAQTAVDFARQSGFSAIYLDCMSTSTAAVKLYEKLGFIKTEKYNKNNFADTFMKMELRAVQSL